MEDKIVVTVKPFNGIRYNKSDVSKLICPPYDIISEAERRRLSSLAANNFVNIELPRKYKNAQNLLNRMINKGILVADNPSIYIYSQEFEIDDKKYKRSGIISLVKLEDPEKGSIYPHEKTLLTARKDRRMLLHALKANTSPIFFIAEPDKNRWRLIKKIISTAIPDQIARTEGITHMLWKISDDAVIRALVNNFRNKKLYIADGHHRYAVAYDYSLKNKSEAAKYVLGFISDASDKNLMILPTHRVCEIPSDLSESFSNFVDITESEFKKTSMRPPQPLQIRLNGKTRYLKLKNRKFMDKLLPGQSFELKNIAPSIAKHIILAKIEPSEIYYTHSASEAVKKADTEGKIAVILPPTPLKALLKISRNREYMPQKSTYFFPKVFAGFVIYRFFPPRRDSARSG